MRGHLLGVCMTGMTSFTAALLRFTAALLLLYCCFTAALLLLYCCFTAALLLLY
jgi:hypothetical protein